MSSMIHLLSAVILLTSHLIFLVRSFVLLKTGKNPRPLDKIFLQLSQIFLPLTLLTGFITLTRHPGIPLTHLFLGISPLVLMFVIRKKSFRRRFPWLLPLISGILLAGTFLSGLFL